mgnify:CR=1 FL=1
MEGFLFVEVLVLHHARLAPLLRRCKPEHIANAYELPFAGLDGSDDEKQADAFAQSLARKMGRLLKGGEPDTRTVAVQMINDWQRGKMPHFVAPPEDPNRPPREGAAPDWADEDKPAKKSKGKARASATN